MCRAYLRPRAVGLSGLSANLEDTEVVTRFCQETYLEGAIDLGPANGWPRHIHFGSPSCVSTTVAPLSFVRRPPWKAATPIMPRASPWAGRPLIVDREEADVCDPVFYRKAPL